MTGELEVPGTVRIPVAVLAERRPGATPWAEWSWRAVEVLEGVPDLPPWTVLREEAGRTLFLAGRAEVALHPTDTPNYRDNLQADPPREVEVEVLSEANAADYARRSDRHDLALDIAEGRPGQHGLARALERFIAHVLGEEVAIRPAAVIEDPDWRWHVGLDAEATAITNGLWNGEAVEQARLARILWLGALEFADDSRVLPRARGKPVYLALAMDAAQRVRCKPQNLVAGLPLLSKEAGA